MSEFYTEEDVLVRVDPLTRTQLTRFVQARVVAPAHNGQQTLFRRSDLARLELLCELTETFEMRDDALDLVMSLVDQLHGVRAELRAVMEAVEAEPEEVRARVVETLWSRRAGDR